MHCMPSTIGRLISLLRVVTYLSIIEFNELYRVILGIVVLRKDL